MQDERDLPQDVPPGLPADNLPADNLSEESPATAAESQTGPTLPDALRNWHVLEIDGQAAGSTVAPEPPPAPESTDLQISDRQDDWIVVSLDHRRQQVEAGATAEYHVIVLNNGPLPAAFHLQAEGWIVPRWAGASTPLVQIDPGARAKLILAVTPPRQPDTEAGDHHFALAVRALEYPGRLARLGAALNVLPYDVLDMRFLEGTKSAVSWLHRSATLSLAVANRSNHPLTLMLHGSDARQVCTFDFAAPGAVLNSATLTLNVQQALTVPVRVGVQHFPWLGIQPRPLPVQVEAWIDDRPVARTRAALAVRPVIGPVQAAIAGLLTIFASAGLAMLLALVYLLAQRSLPAQVAGPATGPNAVAAAPAAPPVIIVNLSQPASAPAQTAPGSAASASNSNFTRGESPDPALPMVLPDQVSTPGEGGAPAARAPAAGIAAIPASARTSGEGGNASAAAPRSSANAQTYGQMFQEVGQKYDLDWRILAAQAYVESGFDSLALSNAGAMGLMQVLPNTWREWATAAQVSDPFDSYSNVLVAAAYLDHLRSTFAGKGYPGLEWMLVAYNWGPDKLGDFLAGGGTWDTLPEARRQYATEILRIAKTIP